MCEWFEGDGPLQSSISLDMHGWICSIGNTIINFGLVAGNQKLHSLQDALSTKQYCIVGHDA